MRGRRARARTSSTAGCRTRCCSRSSPTRASGRWCCRDARRGRRRLPVSTAPARRRWTAGTASLMDNYGTPPRGRSSAARAARVWDVDGRAYLDLLGRHRGQRRSVTPTRRSSRPSPAQVATLGHIVATSSRHEPQRRARRAAARPARRRRRRPGVLLQLRRRGQRGGPQARPPHRPAEDRRRRGRVPRPHHRRAGADRPARQAGAVRAAAARRRLRPVRRRRGAARRPSTTTRPRSSSSRSRARPASSSRRPGYLGRGARDRRRGTARCSSLDEVQTGIGRTGAWFAHTAQGVRPDVVTARQGARRRASDRRLRRRSAPPAALLGPGDARLDVRRQPGRVRRGARRARRHRARRPARPRRSTVGARLRDGVLALGHPLVAGRPRRGPAARRSCSTGRSPRAVDGRAARARASSSTTSRPTRSGSRRRWSSPPTRPTRSSPRCRRRSTPRSTQRRPA